MEIPGFTIQRAIGRGGMGTVYLATQESLNRAVVLKTLSLADSANPEFVERFLNEGRIIARLRHPHIVTIYDIGNAGPLVFISMEYVEGGDLRQRLGSPLPPQQALNILSAVSSALECAHDEGIVHRDVKPANILFRSDGTPLLGDFGIAKQTGVDVELTSTGTILGSPFYMSPEQAEGQQVDGRSDIYSLGVILYEMLTGSRPYKGDSAVKLILQHLQQPVPILPGDLSRLQPLLNRMMAKDRNLRVQQAATLVRLVSDFRQAECATTATLSLRAKPARAAYRGGRDVDGRSALRSRVSAGRHLPALLSALAALTLGLAGVYMYAQALKTPRVIVSRPPPPPQPQLASTEGVTPRPFSERSQPLAPPLPAGGSQPQRDEVVRALAWLARTSLKQDRLTAPPADNAHYYYSRLLALNPRDQQAQAGITAVAERYVVLAEKEFARENIPAAQAHIQTGLEVQPHNEGLLKLREIIAERDKNTLETILEFVRGSE